MSEAEFKVTFEKTISAADSETARTRVAEYLAENANRATYRVEEVHPEPRTHSIGVPPQLRETISRFRGLQTESEVFAAFAETGVQLIGRPPKMSADDREDLKRAWGFTSEEEVDEALELSGLVTVTVGEVANAARTAKYPLTVAKAIVGASRGLDSQLRLVVPVLRERGCSWSQIGRAVGTTKQSAWERFSGED